MNMSPEQRTPLVRLDFRRDKWLGDGGNRLPVLASAILFAFLGVLFFTQNPIEARSRPWRGPDLSEDGWY